MNHCVPHFEMQQQGQSIPIPTPSTLIRQHNTTRPEDEIMELLWQNGPVVVQSQNQNKFPRRSPQPHHPPPPPQQQHQQPAQLVCDSTSQLFMQDDEMSTWLHFPPDYSSGGGGDIYADLLYTPPPPQPPPPPTATAHAVPVQQTDPPHLRPQLSPTLPPPPHPVMQPVAPNFAHFSRMRPLPPLMFADTGPQTTPRRDQHHHDNNHHIDARERDSTTVVDSSDTPMVAAGISRPNRASHHHHTVRNSSADATTDDAGWSFGGRDTMMSGGGGGGLGGVGRGKADGGGGGCLSASRDGETCELTLTSSPGGSGASASGTATGADDTTEVRAPVVDRKRKSRETAADGTDCHSEDVEIESAEARKQCRGSSGTKRSRAAEVHNLSERRRRDRINEKMKALQELIPRCSKTDKASMLDEAIEYLKSLQLQVQVMTSMGCGLIPMMFPGVQQYMPHMGMGMGMGMGMDMGMNRPMMPFPALLAGSALQPSGVAPHMGPRFQIPGFPMPPPVPPPDMSRIQVTGQADLAVNPLGLSGQPNVPIMPNMADPYQQYLRMQQMQNQPIAQPRTSKPSTSKGSAGRENPRNG